MHQNLETDSTIMFLNNSIFVVSSAGSVACSCNPATGRPVVVDGLRLGALLDRLLCWAGVRTKPGVDMGAEEESFASRSSKDERTGPGGKLSSQKLARRSSSGIAPASSSLSAAQPIQSHLQLFSSEKLKMTPYGASRWSKNYLKSYFKLSGRLMRIRSSK